ncbi:Glucosamine-6-phosphate deaminase [subsurface metagenome]
MTSRVEEQALPESKQKLIYKPLEKIGAIVVNSFPALGRLAALRFLEWVRHNPEGVISLPTGKTPEYFIKEVIRLLNGWDRKEIGQELEEAGLDPSLKPDLRGLHFVQIDEFYPINPLRHNSFHYYVSRFYLKGFGLSPEKAILIDCSSIGLPDDKSLEEIWPDDEVDLSLRYRMGSTNFEKMQKRFIEAIDQWCTDYEGRIRELGGIGFFLGGIGPDGHIGFNVRGSDLYSTTRLTRVNYETQAAAAADLGGMEVARKRLVITIGLATITHNPDCLAIIMAAGEARARIVAESIQNPPHIRYPATVLQDLPNARFYLTRGAARLLTSRHYESLLYSDTLTDAQVEKAVVDLSLEKRKKILDLTAADFQGNPLTALLLQRSTTGAAGMTCRVAAGLKEKIEAGTRVLKGTVFLHTEPHHDDLTLASGSRARLTTSGTISPRSLRMGITSLWKVGSSVKISPL